MIFLPLIGVASFFKYPLYLKFAQGMDPPLPMTLGAVEDLPFRTKSCPGPNNNNQGHVTGPYGSHTYVNHCFQGDYGYDLH
jgi:hypothetical protein